jgi:hypothetical protein
MFSRPHLGGKKLGMAVNTCHPSYDRKLKNKRIEV